MPSDLEPLQVKRLTADARLPERGSPDAAGLDLFASEEKILKAGTHAAVATGISVALPAESAGLIWPRSGLAAKHGIDTLAGVIDADYRGEIRVVLINHGPADYTIRKGDRIAQMLIQKIEFIGVVESDSLPDSVRGVGGFGSSGR